MTLPLDDDTAAINFVLMDISSDRLSLLQEVTGLLAWQLA
jgi:hypothetical protein